jgi:BirA family biotin operon repressor/biotin-[acetyl-CoA-carboxylase] ligase
MTDSLKQSLLNEEVARLCEAGELPLEQVKLSSQTLAELGFSVGGATVAVPHDLELLNADLINSALSESAKRWLRRLTVVKVTGSTNSQLLDEARVGEIDGVVSIAEVQTAGRGRRGRHWLSPIGQNLALSLGALIPLEPAKLSGLSLAIGLAVHDVLLAVGADSVSLKWPNDVLLSGSKIAGILVELAVHPRGTQVVVGVGINVRIPPATILNIEQPIADLASLTPAVSRNFLAATLISSLLDYLRGFETTGFAPMRELFNANHAFHQRRCRVLLGEREVHGVVAGVTDKGELILETDGVQSAYSSGEVSLRRD